MVRRACESVSPVALGGAICALLLFSGCGRDSARARQASLTPLKADSWLIALDVPGFGQAALAVPLGATAPRPIVIALHGSADRPEWACSALRSIAGPVPFVLCPRGVPRTDLPPAELRFSFGSSEDTARELRAALSALKQRFGAHVAPGPVVFVGFEIGADHASAIAGQAPAFFSRLLLIEPAPSSWPSSESALFGREGGQRVLFAFGSAHRAELEQKAVLTGRGGADARAVFLDEPAPSLDASTRALLGKHWRWLSAPPRRSDTAENLAGNALSAGGPTRGRPAQ